MGTTSRVAVIAAEQLAVDRAYACYEAKLAELADGAAAGAAASGKDGIVARAEARARADVFRLDDENLVTMRVDAQPDGAAEPEVFYLGRRTVHDPETSDTVVISWTNALATAWRLATPDAPGEVRLRRRLDCDGRTVTDYRDDIVPSAATGAEAGVPSPGDADRTARTARPVVDDLLLRDLDRSRRTRMRDIVETIQPDQMALVAGPSTDVLVVQGGPGTGKSAVGLHRVTWLVDNRRFRAEDILVVGPHRRFLEYVGRVLPTLGTRNVTAVELPLLWPGSVRAQDDASVRRVKSDERMAEVLRRRVEGNCRRTAVEAAVAPAEDGREEPVLTVVLGSAPLRVPASEVLRAFDDARDGTGHYRARRDRFRNLLVDRLLAALQQGFPQRALDQAVRRDVERHRQVSALVERAWPPLSPEEALRSLLNTPARLAECASGVLDAQEQALLRRPAAERAEDEPWTLDDLVCLEELRSLISGETPQRYPHIVVDEAQDLTPMQARSLRRRNPKGSMTVLGDLAQATGPHGYADWERIARILAGEGGWHLEQLTTSYRVPARIMEFVAPLAREVAPSVPFPVAVKEADGEAVRIVETTPWQLLAEAVGHAARLAGSDGRTQRSIALVVPEDSDWLAQVQLLVDSAEEMTDEVREAVTVLTAGEAKGMEFDHVLVLEPATITARGPEGARQLYVALTRSTQTLTVLHASPLPAVMLPAADGTPPADADADRRPGPGTVDAVRSLAVDEIEVGTEAGTVFAGLTPEQPGPASPGFPARLRRSLAADLAKGHVEISPRGALLVRGISLTWTLSPDGRSVVSVRRHTPLDAEIHATLGLPEADELEPGTGLRVRALAHGDRFHWRVTPVATDRQRRYVLELRQDDPRPEPGQELDVRVVRRHSDVYVVAADAAPGTLSDEEPAALGGPSPAALLTAELRALADRDRTCLKHEAVRHQLKSSLLFAGHRPDDSPIADVIRPGARGPVVYEVLPAGRTSYHAVRAGAVRLREIAQVLPDAPGRLCVVLPEAPDEPWIPELVQRVLDVAVMWHSPTGWQGPGGSEPMGAADDA
ncbi:AAA family ATPase [Kitasatospora sp. RG8]|uniref:AAA family ATPase n=1 Tax=Kitasatospora sp. RG8 TaxID=2820815 RepID=UPI0027DB20EB|nr:AAA family ATPase [Kitasatospora sp. RG8]